MIIMFYFSMEEVLSSETNENTWMAGWILLASQLSMRYWNYNDHTAPLFMII